MDIDGEEGDPMIEREVILAPPGEEDEEDVEQWDVSQIYDRADGRMRIWAAPTRKRIMAKSTMTT